MVDVTITAGRKAKTAKQNVSTNPTNHYPHHYYPIPTSPIPNPNSTPRPSSHQSGPITHHWNDLPPSLLPKPYSASASRSTSPHPQQPQPLPQPSPPDLETLLEPLIEKLFSAQSTIPDAQRRQLKEKVLRAAPGMSDGQRGEVVEILLRWDGGGGKKEGREAVVGFMVRERGVAGWAMCLRRGFEGLV
ncbi:hypothetical protein B9Z19DRAFT_1166185 [Tuber borchii]|uniref:Uncharacterized protein n=1 Tax=Tuber borchii TaxID=42251 RepID=A0A2T6ZBN1_TUBBO|nr:hypothetical protein B9Z19DRAFT_1166185 [Tuber borchii]